MSMDDTSYLTTYEAALAVVATAMKKARLRIDILVINSIIGGMVFATGGMLHVLIQSEFMGALETNPGVVSLLSGFMYPIGLFYVVILGVDLFNSNILFFSVGLCRGAVSIWDLLISWIVSWWFNLVGNIFVCYVICKYSALAESELMMTGSVNLFMKKASFSFVQTFIKAIAGNFYVCLAIFLQLMAKPLHVKFLMMILPVFTFVSFGFTHAVADMYVIILGLINGANVTVATTAWKLFLPAALGNIVGGSFFGVVITWYLHLYVVEQDRKKLELPQYDLRDEQPELNQDSRVVRQKQARFDQDLVKLDQSADSSDMTTQDPVEFNPVPIYDEVSIPLAITQMRSRTRGSVSSTKSTRSPKNVFPVYGMGAPLARERTIAGQLDEPKRRASGSTNNDYNEYDPNETPAEPEAEYLGAQLKRVLTHKSRALDKDSDLESGKFSPRVLTPRSSIIGGRRKSNLSDISSVRFSPGNSNQEKDLGDTNTSNNNNNKNLSKEQLDRILEK